MAKDDQQEAFQQILTVTLGRTIDFLKFAETKNAALLTLSSAWILASITLMTGTNLGPEWQPAITIALTLFVCAALSALASFLPKTALSHFHKDPDQTKALLFSRTQRHFRRPHIRKGFENVIFQFPARPPLAII